MSINKLVSVKVAVLNAIQNMGLGSAKDIPLITRWAIEAENEIGSYYSLKKIQKVIHVTGCTYELPCEVSMVKGILLGDYGCDCTDLFNKLYSAAPLIVGATTTDTFLVIDKPDSTTFSCGGVSWEIQNNKIVFQQKFTKQPMTIQYLGMEQDDEGFVKVGENHLLAIVNYIMWMFSIRSRFSPVKMDHTDISRFEKMWNSSASGARADDAELSESDRAAIVAMIHDPWIGHGMPLLNNKDSIKYG